MVVIQKREYGKNGTIYYQYRLNIPQKIIDLLRWNCNDEIDFFIDNSNGDGKLIVSLICKNITKSTTKKES